MAAQDAGADAVSLVNTLKGMAVQPDSREPWLGGGTGGVSGPAIRAIALEHVAAVASRLEIPVVGMGGIASGRHARDFLAAGAAAVAVGTESFRDPAAGRRIAAELAALSLSSEQGNQSRDACDPVWGTARRGFVAECGNFETQPADRSNLLDQNPCKRH